MKRSTKATFIETKKPFIIYDIDLNKILIVKKELYGKKAHLNFIRYNDDDDVIRPLCIKLDKMVGYVKSLIVMRQFLPRSLIKGH